MPRNLYNRVELLTPVAGDDTRDELTDVLDRAFADNTSSWELSADGSWRRLEPGDGEPRSLQKELLAIHSARAKDAATEAVVPA